LTAEEQLVSQYTRVRAVPMVPEIRLHLADELVPLWEATEWRAAAPQPPPFWAFAWPGSIALARYVLDSPTAVRGLSTLDFGSGSGLAAIACALCGAREVVATDVDPLAAVAQRLNAQLNGVAFASVTADATARNAAEVILAGDVCYEREPAEATLSWLRQQAAAGAQVLLADPGRHYAPSDGLELLATYEVPVLRELESVDSKRTRLWRLHQSTT
jgi:predicted nicotinamide N-methyase